MQRNKMMQVNLHHAIASKLKERFTTDLRDNDIKDLVWLPSEIDPSKLIKRLKNGLVDESPYTQVLKYQMCYK